MNNLLAKSREKIEKANHLTAFTGAGISVESGIPSFRGPDGLWSKYDPGFLEIDYFHKNPLESWKLIKEIFYDFFGQAKPNAAHRFLADLEARKNLQAVITQNIDSLHQKSGSKKVVEFHGGSSILSCENCGNKYVVTEEILTRVPPLCRQCGRILKPDFVFFGEAIPTKAYESAIHHAELSDVMLVIGTTGEVMPACQIPVIAKRNGCHIIEINKEPSQFTHGITDIFIEGPAGEICSFLS